MTTLAHTTSTSRTHRRQRRSPAALGLRDPRPVTDYTVAIATVAGKSRITVTLLQPCVVREPRWAAIDVSNGSKVYPLSATVLSTTSFSMDYAAVLQSNFAFIEAPYQDTQVQNFQGGFVVSGGKWFRSPV